MHYKDITDERMSALIAIADLKADEIVKELISQGVDQATILLHDTVYRAYLTAYEIAQESKIDPAEFFVAATSVLPAQMILATVSSMWGTDKPAQVVASLDGVFTRLIDLVTESFAKLLGAKPITKQ